MAVKKHDPKTCPHCFGIPPLPEGLTEFDAAKNAVACYPGNAPSEMLMATAGGKLDPVRITILTSKWWGPKVDLGVRFLDTNNAELKAKILHYANMWGKYGNILFRESNSSTADIRINRGSGGYYAYLGTDMRLIPTSQHNMNLEGFSLSTPDSEYGRVVCHEFGHALGCPHEQSRPEVLARLDRNKTYAFYAQQYGWNRATVDAQIFTPLDMGSVWATESDETSIMCYQFPGQCTKNGQPIPGGFKINDLDGSLLAKHYPKAEEPDDPEEPTEPTRKSVRVTWDGFTPATQQAFTTAGVSGFNFTVEVGPPHAAGQPAEQETWVSDISEYAADLLAKAEELVEKYGSKARAVLKAAKAFADDPGFLTAMKLWEVVQSFGVTLRPDPNDAYVASRSTAGMKAAHNWVSWIKVIVEVLTQILDRDDEM